MKKKLGWEDRVIALQQIKKNSEFLSEITQPDYDPFKNELEEVEKYIKELEKEGDMKPHTNFFRALGNFILKPQ